MNPCKDKWDLCKMPEHYLHSSARYYFTGVHGIYEVNNIAQMKDKEFVIRETPL